MSTVKQPSNDTRNAAAVLVENTYRKELSGVYFYRGLMTHSQDCAINSRLMTISTKTHAKLHFGDNTGIGDSMQNAAPNEGSAKRGYLDTVAVVFSAVCMLHCLALPIIFTILPIVNVALLDEQSFHLLMLVFILPVSLIALSIGCRQHKDPLTLTLGIIGLGALTFTAVFGHDLFGLSGERLATSAGSLVLALAHIQNYRCCRKNDCQHEH